MLDTPARTSVAQVPTLSLSDQARDPDAFAAALVGSFERFGFAIVADHGVDDALIRRAWRATEALFKLPEAEKRG
jgi:isopenicillin N synthase-like dioxygenase